MPTAELGCKLHERRAGAHRAENSERSPAPRGVERGRQTRARCTTEEREGDEQSVEAAHAAPRQHVDVAQAQDLTHLNGRIEYQRSENQERQGMYEPCLDGYRKRQHGCK